MIQTKYLIIIGAIVCLLILYYFYDEISKVKKIILPAYQKTMALEAKVMVLEKKANEMISSKKKLIMQKNDSPALSITYQSDMVKNGNLSVKYADLSDTEAKELVKNINQNKIKQNNNDVQINGTNQQLSNILHQNNYIQSNDKNKIENNKNHNNVDTETINLKMTDILKKNPVKMEKTDQLEYQKIFNELSRVPTIHSENVFDEDTELDQDIIRSISESIQYADMPSDSILSDLPPVTTKYVNRHKKKSNKKSINKIK